MSKIKIGLLIALVCLDAFVNLRAETKPVGYVKASAGNWLQNGVKIDALSASEVLPGSTIVQDPADPDKSASTAFIIIYLFDGQRIERTWKKLDDFKKPIHIEPEIKEIESVQRLLIQVAQLFRRGPQRYALTISRGGRDAHLQEAVLRYNRGPLDLAPALANTPSGHYRARLQQVGAGKTKPSGPLVQQEIDWGTSKSASLVSTELKSGIWQISLVSMSDGKVMDGNSWILLTDSGAYPAADSTLAEARRLCDSWDKSITDEERQSFLRECLDVADANKQ